jgi:hypothetical protein
MRPTAVSVTIALGLALLASLWQSALAENKDAAFAFRYNDRENVDIFDAAIAADRPYLPVELAVPQPRGSRKLH